MNLLILGGTIFLGRHLVLAALQAGHKVTTFNRGNHEHAEQSHVERLLGDRNNVELLSGRTWDAVIDVCGREPEIVSKSAEKLRDSVQKYVFISSISAYRSFPQIGMTEMSPLTILPVDAEPDYGSNKAQCEKIVTDIYADKSLVVRPGLIVGRYDPTDRFTYWVRRIARGGRVLAPGRPEHPVQFIDVRDLSEWMIRLVEAGSSGIFNAKGPGFVFSMKELLQECKKVSQSQAELIWVADEKLVASGITPWSELPLWIPESEPEGLGYMAMDCTKAQNAGLSYRTPGETIEEILAWDSLRDQSVELKAGLDPIKETSLLSTYVLC